MAPFPCCWGLQCGSSLASVMLLSHRAPLACPQGEAACWSLALAIAAQSSYITCRPSFHLRCPLSSCAAPQGSVLGSGFAGIVCAAGALALGDPFPWRVRAAAAQAAGLWRAGAPSTCGMEPGLVFGRLPTRAACRGNVRVCMQHRISGDALKPLRKCSAAARALFSPTAQAPPPPRRSALLPASPPSWLTPPPRRLARRTARQPI